MDLSYILNHLGENRKEYFNAICPPIIQSSNFSFDTIDEFRNAIGDEFGHSIYTRGNNPTVEILRKKMAALEHAEDALVTGSGAAAIALAITANLKADDHIVCVQAPYSWTHKLLTKILNRFDITHDFVDGRNIQAIKTAIQPHTKVLYLESPNSLTYELQDLMACADLAKENDIITICDNSYSSPIFQNPILMGIDIVVHSGTKYLNGHSDVVVGVICGKTDMIQKIFESEYMTFGSIISPADAALVIRGLRTLPLRMKKSHESAVKIVEWLEKHPKVDKVLYPFAPSFPQYELAQKQMSGAGGLFSVYLKMDNIKQAEDFFHHLQHFLLAVSWGGHESLVLPLCGFHRVPGKEDSVHPWNLYRFYIGLEEVDFLIQDLEQALSKIP